MRSAGGSRLAPDLLQIGFFEGNVDLLNFDAVRASPARSARPSAPRTATRPVAAEEGTCGARA